MLIFLLFNGSLYFQEKQWSDNDQLQLFADSAGGSQLGCAAILGCCWSFLRWPSVWSDSAILKDITFLELVPIVLAFYLWGLASEQEDCIAFRQSGFDFYFEQKDFKVQKSHAYFASFGPQRYASQHSFQGVSR